MSDHLIHRIKRRLRRLVGKTRDHNIDPVLGKTDIVNLLGKENAYTTYLEVATRTTGCRFEAISPQVFSTRQRILYNIPADFSDGLPIHRASAGLDSRPCFQHYIDSGEQFDVVFIDPYHTYTASMTDIGLGFQLVRPGGVMVVHDCNPPNQQLTSPEFQVDNWMGETYLAFLAFVESHPDLEYCVVDTDWGVGLVFKPGNATPAHRKKLPRRPDLANYNMRDWQTFNRHRRKILRLVSLRRFMKTFLPTHGLTSLQ